MPRAINAANAAKKPYDRPSASAGKAKQEPGSSSLSESEDGKDVKPHPTSSDETETKPRTKKPSKSKRGVSSTKAPGRTWTGPELVALFEIAVAGTKRTDYEDKLEGRTGMQCLKTWQNTIVPFIKTALMQKGEGKR